MKAFEICWQGLGFRVLNAWDFGIVVAATRFALAFSMASCAPGDGS